MNQKRFTNLLLIGVIVVLIGVVGYFVLVKKSEPATQSQIIDTTVPPLSSQNGVNVSEPESKRVVSVNGYFFRKNTIDWGEVPVTCDTLIVTGITGGDKSLIDEFIQWVKNGNTINALDEKTGNLILNLNLNKLSQTEKQRIVLSTLQNKVELKVIDTRSEGRGAPACHSFVQILKVD